MEMSSGDLIADLRNQLSLAIDERDCAVEMWQLTKQVVENSEYDTPSVVRREMDEMKMEYSEAIKLLETKCSGMERLLQNSHTENHKLGSRIVELSSIICDLEKDVQNKTLFMSTMEKEKESLKMSLDQTKEMLKMSEQVSLQARDKVADALNMAQDALANEASIAEEKAQLEMELSNKILSYEAKIVADVSKVRTELEDKVGMLSSELHTVTLERNRLSHEVESLKSECRVVEKQLSSTNSNLVRELDELRCRMQNDSSMWFDERDSLRRQVTTLQGEVETLLAQVKLTPTSCDKCDEYRFQTERYRKLAKRWEEAADRVTTDFEKYLQEARDYYAQQNSEAHFNETGST